MAQERDRYVLASLILWAETGEALRAFLHDGVPLPAWAVAALKSDLHEAMMNDAEVVQDVVSDDDPLVWRDGAPRVPFHPSSDGCEIEGDPSPTCGCQSCRDRWGAPEKWTPR